MQEENRELLSSFAFRLAARAEHLGFSQTLIAERLGVKSPRVSNWFQGRNFPRAREKVELAKLLGVNLDWLIQGIGEPESFSQDPLVQDAIDQHGIMLREVPVISWTHAGEAATYDAMPKHWHGTVATKSRDRRAFALTIEGDSMEPKFFAGDCVILEPGSEPRNGKPVVAKFANDAVQLRIFHKLPDGRIRLSSLRPEIYATEEHPASAFHWIFPVCGLYRPI